MKTISVLQDQLKRYERNETVNVDDDVDDDEEEDDEDSSSESDREVDEEEQVIVNCKCNSMDHFQELFLNAFIFCSNSNRFQ